MEKLEKIVASLKDNRPLLKIGWTGENQARGVVWDISGWQVMYGDGNCVLLNQRESDAAPYPCSIEVDGKFAVWRVEGADLGSGGNGKCQLVYTIGDEVVAKSPVYTTMAKRSLGNQTQPPESASGWVAQVLQAGKMAADAARKVENALEITLGFQDLGKGLKIVDGKLVVDTADVVEEDNTLPVTSAAVYETVGNIDALLQTI